MSEPNIIGAYVWINRSVELGDNVTIGHSSCIGYGGDTSSLTTIGSNVTIGAFCVVHLSSHIGDDVEIDHYCRIGHQVRIGTKSKILYGTQVFNKAQIGENCIVGGDLSERTIVEDYVTFMGSIAHNHRNPNLDWDTTDEPSPIFRRGSVVGVDSLIIGGVTIGPYSYVSAGERVNYDVPPKKVVFKGKMYDLDEWRGIIKVRGLE